MKAGNIDHTSTKLLITCAGMTVKFTRHVIAIYSPETVESRHAVIRRDGTFTRYTSRKGRWGLDEASNLWTLLPDPRRVASEHDMATDKESRT